MKILKIGAPRTHRGACDASGAVQLGKGSSLFLVADDEDQRDTFIRLYDAASNGAPLEKFLLDKAKIEPDPDQPELDLEAAAWLGRRIYWIGSHSRNAAGELRPSRHLLFATVLARKNGKLSLTVVGTPYKRLVADLTRAFVKNKKPFRGLNLDPAKPPKVGGLSIEGLSATRNPGELLVAVRSPLVKKRALLVRLQNATQVIDGKRPRFGPPILLDLKKRGVRSIEYWPQRDEFLLLAGPPGDTGSFRLMRWSGDAKARPRTIKGLKFKRLKLGKGVAPEAIFIDPRSETVYVLFDEGRRSVGPKQCKDSAQKSFRSVAIKLP